VRAGSCLANKVDRYIASVRLTTPGASVLISAGRRITTSTRSRDLKQLIYEPAPAPIRRARRSRLKARGRGSASARSRPASRKGETPTTLLISGSRRAAPAASPLSSIPLRRHPLGDRARGRTQQTLVRNGPPLAHLGTEPTVRSRPARDVVVAGAVLGADEGSASATSALIATGCVIVMRALPPQHVPRSGSATQDPEPAAKRFHGARPEHVRQLPVLRRRGGPRAIMAKLGCSARYEDLVGPGRSCSRPTKADRAVGRKARHSI